MKALIPAAGSGTRWFPWSRIIPKELLPFGNYPVIHYVLDEAAAAGIMEIGIIISEKKKLIKSYIQNVWSATHPEVRLKWFYQKEARGVGDALLCAGKWVKNGPAAILYPDEVHPEGGGISLLYKAFQKAPGCWLGLTSEKQDRRQMEVAIKKTGENTFSVSEVNIHGRSDRIGYGTGRYVFDKGFSHVKKTLSEIPYQQDREFDDDQFFKPLWDKDIHGIILPGPIYDMGTPENWSFAISNNYSSLP